jgi:hypothetical protein
MSNPSLKIPQSTTPIRTYLPTVTNSMKWWLAIFLGFIAFLIFLPVMYNLTNSIWTGLGLPSLLNGFGSPKVVGVLIQAILFALLIRLILW